MATDILSQEAQTAGDAPVTRKTLLHNGGQIARQLMLNCTHEIEALTLLSVDLLDDSRATGALVDDTSLALQLRSASARMHALNSLLMSFLDGNDSVTVFDASRELMIDIDFDKELTHA